MYVKDAVVLQNEQFGFQQHHSADHQVARVTEPLAIKLIDLAKAFDRV